MNHAPRAPNAQDPDPNDLPEASLEEITDCPELLELMAKDPRVFGAVLERAVERKFPGHGREAPTDASTRKTAQPAVTESSRGIAP